MTSPGEKPTDPKLAAWLSDLCEGNELPPKVVEFLRANAGRPLHEKLETLLVDPTFREQATPPPTTDGSPEGRAGGQDAPRTAPGEPGCSPEENPESTDSNQAESDRPALETVDWRPASPEATRTDGSFAIDRYRVVGMLGEGGFGRVLLAYDESLKRLVAIKVPLPHRASSQADIEASLEEAQALASLDHPAIVPVYDVGHTRDGLCFVVSKVIEGKSLTTEGRRFRSDYPGAARLIASVADALHHAHGKGLVHRDVKPGNILVDAEGRPYLTDFGLALREADFGKGLMFAGTPAYMSPEQARGEGHRVDRRTDVFSLGAVLYEVLTGDPPFGVGGNETIMGRVAAAEFRPPRQVVPAIPRELERICLRAMARRACDRYDTAEDFADDLRQFADEADAGHTAARNGAASRPSSGGGGTSTTDSLFGRTAPVSPKGLRSFDGDDAHFFQDLLPGPRDRHGLAEPVRFWKARIERTNPDETFAVGLIYGPSGCGKSSLVKAGLIPRLAPHVTPLYLESDGDDLEARLLKKLRRACPGLDPGPGLAESLAAFRRGSAAPAGSKVLLVLDQFEQWLHANRERSETELVAALRQCDGGRLQAVVLVRDEFWMASSRFMQELEVRVVEGHNAAAVDLFTPRHAVKVLAAFGRAFDALPARADAFTTAQRDFLERAVAALAQEGKVIPVRLALFAEMVKGKPWTAATLRNVGGAVGVGVAFLDEMFASATAPPEHRGHEKAARAVLRALLPRPGADIKGHMRSRLELLEASGYSQATGDFEALMQVLDGRTRLLTPILPEDLGAGCDASSTRPPEAKFYQLTHDYLVASIREWLARKQRETRRGRAELRLGERASLWAVKPEPKQLPSLAEWLEIRLATTRRSWADSERAMMAAADRHHVARTGLALIVLFALVLIAAAARDRIVEERRSAHAEDLVQRLLDASIGQVPAIVAEVAADRRRTEPLIRKALADPGLAPSRRLRARLALEAEGDDQAAPLYDRLLESAPDEFRVLRDALLPRREPLLGRLWEELETPGRSPERRFRAAVALATYDPGSRRWEGRTSFVVDQLVEQPSLLIPGWVDALRPIKDRLVEPLTAGFRERPEGGARRILAEVLADYAGGRPDLLADLLADAGPSGFAVLYRTLEPFAERAVSALESIRDRPDPPGRAERRDRPVKRRVNASIALLRLGKADQLWPLLKADPDPRLRCSLIDRLGPLGEDPRPLAARLSREPDASVRAALLLALGKCAEKAFPSGLRAELAGVAEELYRHDPDAEVHAAARWLLRGWGEPGRVAEIDRELAGRPAGRGQRWSVNGLGLTMVRLDGPVEFLMGSPEGEPARKLNEPRHKVRIARPFEIAATEVTEGQFLPFLERYPEVRPYFDLHPNASPDFPRAHLTWYDAARYCNWLSEREGIPKDQWCFLPNSRGEYASGMSLAPGYLARIGYRLPSEAEWEYACRAGTTTTRHFGEDELITRYALTILSGEEHPVAVGTFLPNPFGLFDMHGNLTEWCQEHPKDYESAPGGGAVVDVEDTSEVSDPVLRASRGGSFVNHPRRVRSSGRFEDRPSLHPETTGFRPARSRP